MTSTSNRLLGIAIATAFAAHNCLAQTALSSGPGTSQAEQSQTSAADVGTLQAIVVTATRRQESASNVPISINALTAHDLDRLDIKDLADVAAVTPGLQFATPVIPSTITTVSIRGLDSYTGPYMTGIYLNDTPLQGRLSSYGNIGSPMPLIFDLKSVEVDRGPQGTLFGSGSEAGTVRFITNDPSLEQFSGSVQAEGDYTKYGAPSYEGGIAAGGPIDPGTLGFRVAAWARHDGGYVDLRNPITQALVEPNVNSVDSAAFRAAVAYQLDKVRLTPSVYFQSVKRGDSGWFNAYYSDPSRGVFNNEPFVPETSSDKWFLPTFRVDVPLGFANLVSTTSYMHRVVDAEVDFGSVFFPQYALPLPALGPGAGYGSPLAYDVPTSADDAAPSPTGQRDRVFTQEVRLASNTPASMISWVAGAFYERHYQQDWQNSTELFINPSGGSIFNVNQKYTDQQIALYGQGDIHLTRHWTATAGVRVSRETSDFWVLTGPPPGGTPLTADLTQYPTTPKVAIAYKLNSRNLFYLSASKGYRMGGGNGALLSTCPFAAPETFKSDYLWSYEVGAKNKLFDDRVEIDASVYHVDWHNIEQLLNVSSCGLSYTTNAGDAESNGFDLAIRAQPTEHLFVSVGVNYSNAFYTNTVYVPGSSQVAIAAGDKIGSLPEVIAPWNVTVTPEYRIPLANGALLHLSAEDLYTSRNPGPFLSLIPGGPSYLPLEQQNPATNLLNLRAGYTVNGLDVSIFANNALNSLPRLNRVSDGTEASVYQLYESTFRPLTLGVALSYNY